jgi:hypothetical protein
MEVHERLLRTDAAYLSNRMVSEANAVLAMVRRTARTGVCVIPVVVHVVHKTAAQNISDAQINSQIAVLNRDFRRTNTDIGNVPAAFQPLVADAQIEFVLATSDPDGNPTTGIVRVSTTANDFTDDDKVKSAATGGSDAWPADRYLNIWVCQLTPWLGYAQFPGGSAATDGVVVLHSAFGTSGTAAAPFDLGRTTTHEVGHWLNLRHIWGDAIGCIGNDLVADTPVQNGPNFGCPTFPSVTCNNGPNGDLFMNYMDYTDDACMVMFTAGQVARMDACLDGDRPGLCTAPHIEPTIKFIDDPQTLKFIDDPQTLKFKDDLQTLKFIDDPQTLKFSDDPQTFKFRDDPQTLKYIDDPQTLKFSDDPQTLKFSDDPQTLKFFDDPQTLKLRDDPQTLKFVDDPQTLKFSDDPQTVKFGDDGGTAPIVDLGKGPELDKPPALDPVKSPAADGPELPGGPPVVGPAPFILSTGHHSMAWTRSFPGAAATAQRQLEESLHFYQQALVEVAQAAQSGRLSSQDVEQANRLYSEYEALLQEYQRFGQG